DHRNSGSTFTLILFLAVVLLANILLVNVFIAMIDQTFSKITGESERQWRLIGLLRRKIPWLARKAHQFFGWLREKTKVEERNVEWQEYEGIDKIDTVFKPAGVRISLFF
ncbi:hypothetical protein HDU76_003376, partial [Blyttiomyces sp. JEL0837]